MLVTACTDVSSQTRPGICPADLHFDLDDAGQPARAAVVTVLSFYVGVTSTTPVCSTVTVSRALYVATSSRTMVVRHSISSSPLMLAKLTLQLT